MAQDKAPATTRLIIPAPRETRASDGAEWYEVVPHLPSRSLHVVQWSTRRVRTAVLQTVVTDDRRFRTEILDGDVRLTAELTLDQAPSGAVRIRGTIAGAAIEIVGDPHRPGSGRTTGSLDALPDDQRDSLRRWARLGDGLNSLVQATRASISCAACLLTLGGTVVTGACCLSGTASCCDVAISSGSTFLSECAGACAPATEAPASPETLLS